MEAARIVGIVLVKNEEKYIHQVIMNIFLFCDKIIVTDNLSTDRTAEIVSGIAEITKGKVEYHLITHPRDSHSVIERYAGTRTWVFGVDGDELYDPKGLAVLRKKINKGEFDAWWLIFGNVLNCKELNIPKRSARGFLAPPCRSMTKLYNFNAIRSWNGPCPERLHGGTVVFKDGFSRTLRYELYKETNWKDSFFRCLHLCFLQRSEKDQCVANEVYVRKNISDMNAERFHQRIWGRILQFFGQVKMSKWKREKYMRGPLVEEDITSFLKNESNIL